MSFGDAWRKAGEEEADFEPPVGTYKTKLVDGGAFTSRAGDDYAKVILQIDAGEFVGRRFQHFMGFKHEVGARINREALVLYGVNPEGIDTIEQLDDAIDALVKLGTWAEVSVSYKDGYIQIKVIGSRTPAVSDVPSGPDAPANGGSSFADAAASVNDPPPF